MAVRPLAGGGRIVTVHLSQIPERKRVEVADRIIRVEGLTGVPAMLIKMAAIEPIEDPAIEVPIELARSKGVAL